MTARPRPVLCLRDECADHRPRHRPRPTYTAHQHPRKDDAA